MLNLTRQERQVIVFLVAMGLLGTGINYLAKINSAAKRLVNISQDFSKVDLNIADSTALIGVYGIGEKLAQRIIDYRNKQGGFRELEELRNIKGITSYKYEKLKDYLVVK